MKIIAVIPARYGSTRFPGKPLVPICGKPLVQRVVEQARKAKVLADVVVATDDDRIYKVASDFCSVEMTSSSHRSGTDRVEEVMRRSDADAVINIQGDEPLIAPEIIEAVAALLQSGKAEMSTAAREITDPEELNNPNVVKVVCNAYGEALYFSRRTIPFLRAGQQLSAETQLREFPFKKHLGIYGYTRTLLKRLVRMPVSSLERAESLEQLRALSNGIKIAVADVSTVKSASIGVDTPEDVARVERILLSEQNL